MCDKDKMLICPIIFGDTYLTDDTRVWKHAYDEVEKPGVCCVCDEPLTFGLRIECDDAMAHTTCCEVVVPMELFSAYDDRQVLLEERNILRPTEHIWCEICTWKGIAGKSAVILMPTYPFGHPNMTVYMAVCQDCADARDVPPHKKLSDIGIIYAKEAK